MRWPGCSEIFVTVAAVRVNERDCRRIAIHRNNRHYAFLIDWCALILATLLPDETGRGSTFRDFSRDHQAMARMFEQFVRNFYRHHAAECGVSAVRSKNIAWAGAPLPSVGGAWPGMTADICLQRATTPLVIDCKFYQQPLKGRYERDTLNSANLYQVFTYVQNLSRESGWENVEGLLLYAQRGAPFVLGYETCGLRIRAVGVDLSVEWPLIHAQLAAAVRPASLAAQQSTTPNLR